jgi:hypothetical protein
MSEFSKKTQELKDRIQALRDLNNSFISRPLNFETSPSNSILNSSPRSEEEEDLSFPFVFNSDLDTIADRDIIHVGAPMALKNAFIPTTPESPSCIAFTPPNEANFSIPVQLLGQLPKYSGSSMEDPNVHLREFFDIFNRANFGQPGNVVGSPSFGRITNTRFPTGESGSSRQVQLGIKVMF